MNGLNNMNTHKQEWMAHAQLLLPQVKVRQFQDGSVRLEQHFHTGPIDPVMKTIKAIRDGVVLSQIDGPLPIMDVIAFGQTTFRAATAWYDYFTTS